MIYVVALDIDAVTTDILTSIKQLDKHIAHLADAVNQSKKGQRERSGFMK